MSREIISSPGQSTEFGNEYDNDDDNAQPVEWYIYGIQDAIWNEDIDHGYQEITTLDYIDGTFTGTHSVTGHTSQSITSGPDYEESYGELYPYAHYATTVHASFAYSYQTTEISSGVAAWNVGTMVNDNGFRVSVYQTQNIYSETTYSVTGSFDYVNAKFAVEGWQWLYGTFENEVSNPESSYTYETTDCKAIIVIDGTKYEYEDVGEGESPTIIAAMTKTNKGDPIVIYSVAKKHEATIQFFVWMKGKITESKIYDFNTDDLVMFIPDNAPLPPWAKGAPSLGYGRIGMIRETTTTIKEVPD